MYDKSSLDVEIEKKSQDLQGKLFPVHMKMNKFVDTSSLSYLKGKNNYLENN